MVEAVVYGMMNCIFLWKCFFRKSVFFELYRVFCIRPPNQEIREGAEIWCLSFAAKLVLRR